MFVACALACAPARAASDLSILDLIELDMGYTTLTDQYYRNVAPQVLLDGARVGMVAYLREHGVDDPQIPLLHARRDGRGVVPAIEQQVGRALVRYGSRVDATGLIHDAIRGEVAALRDPYTVFFNKRELGAFSAALDGRAFGGIGVVLALDAGGAFVVDEVFDGSVAQRAGIVAGERLTAVDGRSLDGRTPDAVGALLRGPIGSRVRIDVAGSDAAIRSIVLTRAAVTPPDVTARLLPGGIGYVALRAFGPDAGAQVHAALRRVRARGAHAIVFDLRGNGGGYESAAVRVASAFVPAGTIVITQTNHGHRVRTAADGSAGSTQPLVVLVDGDSASGSELVTGAIADHRLGTIVGTRTFGKGLVQTLFPLPDGSAMKVTTARYFTPDGRDIDRVGITPDFLVAEPPGARRGVPGSDPQLDAALTLLGRAAAG